MKKQFIEAGQISSISGIKGEVRVTPWADSPEFLTDFKKFYNKTGDEVLTVQKSRVQKNIVVMKFKGVDTPEQAALMKAKIIYLKRKDILLDEDEFLIQDLIGLEVFDVDTDECYGKITDVSQTGANDVYTIDDGENIRLIPAIKDVIIKTDIENEKMMIRPLKGLFDDED